MLSALCCWSCAVSDSTDSTQMSKTYFESWIQLHYPGISPTPLGSYIIEDKEGSGELVGNSVNAPYVYGRYILRDLDGTIQDYTDESVAKQLGLYDSTCYYGPKVWLRKDSTMTAGVDEIVSTMRVGGHRKAVVPGWLNTQIRYKDKDQYLANVTGESSIYEIRIVEIIKDVIAWQADSMKKFVDARFKDRDTTSFGYYYIQTCPPADTASWAVDDEVYFNYTGRLLNGKVFDTTIADTAKVYGLYNADITYSPSYMTWAEKESDLKMNGQSATITGFSKAIFGMRTGEKGIAVFNADLGYGSIGSGLQIPPYSPLVFEIEMIGKTDGDE